MTTQQEAIIAGALFDFAGFLTTREKTLKVGSKENASPIVELIKEWALSRELNLDEALVGSWKEALTAIDAVKEPEPVGWQPIEIAPKDGTLIIGWCLHESDKYFQDDDGRLLTEYGAACEAWSHVEDGVHVIYREPESSEGSWEEGYFHIPGYWAVCGSEGEIAANPTHWMPLPAPPSEVMR